jgi:hypothetical protein
MAMGGHPEAIAGLKFMITARMIAVIVAIDD